MRRWVTVTTFVAALLGCTPMATASVLPSLTTTITMDCSVFTADCAFDPGSLGSPEQGLADFTPVAPGWSAAFNSDPAIAWGFIHGSYIAEFGMGGSFAIAAPGGMQLSGTLTSGVAFSFPGGCRDSRLVPGILEQWVVRGWNIGLEQFRPRCAGNSRRDHVHQHRNPAASFYSALGSPGLPECGEELSVKSLENPALVWAQR